MFTKKTDDFTSSFSQETTIQIPEANRAESRRRSISRSPEDAAGLQQTQVKGARHWPPEAWLYIARIGWPMYRIRRSSAFEGDHQVHVGIGKLAEGFRYPLRRAREEGGPTAWS